LTKGYEERKKLEDKDIELPELSEKEKKKQRQQEL